MTEDLLKHWNDRLERLSPKEAMEVVLAEMPGKKTFSTSFGIEDQMITDMLSGFPSDRYEVFTLDTGRLFPETYDLFARTQRKYKINIKTFFPDEKNINEYVIEHGVNGFYNSLESRKRCCHIRKLIPLERALQGADVWITGLRAEQSESRSRGAFLERDAARQLLKFNPLIRLSLKEVEQYVEQHKVPLNPLYKKGFVSIGCAPCTRAIEPGEDFRAGRWWWEQSHKECGLHAS